MKSKFEFKTHRDSNNEATEANIFIHGYSAGHNAKDRQALTASIPDVLTYYKNIFAFWESSHFSHINSLSRKLLIASTRIHWAAVPATLVTDRAAHFLRIRSRAEIMGKQLIAQLEIYLKDHHPKIDKINLIGHSLGSRLIVSSLRSSRCHQLSINDVLLMGAAVKVDSDEAQIMCDIIKGRLINAYSKSDKVLLMNMGESSLGRNQIEYFENVEMCGFGHTDYWKKLPEVLACTNFKSHSQNPKHQEEGLHHANTAT